MTTTCGACAHELATDARFCENCGAAVQAASQHADQTTPAEPAPTNPESKPESKPEYLPGEGPTGQAVSHVGSGISPVTTIEAPKATPACVSCRGAVEDLYCTMCGYKQPDPRDHFEIVLSPVVAGVCDRGIQHSANQDAMDLAVGPEPGQVVLVVCDGVTSAPLSERASLAAAQVATALLRKGFDTPADARTDGFWSDTIKASATAGQAETVAVARGLGDPPEPPSCTFVAAVADGARIHVGWCGDSRAYLIPDAGEGLILSQDDSIAAQLIASGRPRAEAEADPRAHTITRWLGADAPDPTARTAVFDLVGPTWLLVVSDGLWNYASEPVAVRAQMTKAEALDLASELVAFANTAGGADNVTIAAARLGVPAPAAQPDQPNQPNQPNQQAE
jgi:serine/threonine protein phosphatase PrpC